MNLNFRSEKIKQDKSSFRDTCNEVGTECFEDDTVDIKRVGKFVNSGGKSGSSSRNIFSH